MFWLVWPSRLATSVWGFGPMKGNAVVLGLLPPTANLEHVDPEVPFDCLPGTARPAEISAALSNSFGFGGQNVSLVFTRP